jgi:thioester reductase-like protein
LSTQDWNTLVEQTDSIIHCAASLNRKSEKVCMNVNLKRNASIRFNWLGRNPTTHHGLRRLSFVSTVAVAGTPPRSCYKKTLPVDWNRSDYDPYARTKKFCEHMVTELLPDVSTLIFRPAIILGDSRFSKYDSVRYGTSLCDGLQKLPTPSIR